MSQLARIIIKLFKSSERICAVIYIQLEIELAMLAKDTYLNRYNITRNMPNGTRA